MGNILEVNTDNWEQRVLQSSMLTVVDFWHDHCPWCLQLEPILNEISEEYSGKIEFTKLNVLRNSGNRELAIRYGIMSTPTLVFFCKGRPVGEIVGLVAKENLKKTMDDMLGKYRECVSQSTELKNIGPL